MRINHVLRPGPAARRRFPRIAGAALLAIISVPVVAAQVAWSQQPAAPAARPSGASAQPLEPSLAAAVAKAFEKSFQDGVTDAYVEDRLRPAVLAARANGEHYSTATTSICMLLADPAARAVLRKYIPTNPSIQSVGECNTLRGAVDLFHPDNISEATLAQIDHDLAGSPATARFSTATTPLCTLAADPRARAAVARAIPDARHDPVPGFCRTIRELWRQGQSSKNWASDGVPEQALADIDRDLAALPARGASRTVQAVLPTGETDQMTEASMTGTSTTTYDPATRQLTLACEAAPGDSCKFAIDDGARSTHIAVEVGNRVTIADISPDGRACSLAGNSPCTLVPVNATGSAAERDTRS